MESHNSYINRICDKYNRRHVTAFVRKNAEKRFLGPLGCTLKFVPGDSFSNSRKRFIGKEEFEIFAALHFLKYKLKKSNRTQTKIRYELIYIALRNRIISANWTLVLVCTQKHFFNHPEADESNLITRSTRALMYAVDGFDPWRGFKFSTYACRSIYTSFLDKRRKGRSVNAIATDVQILDTNPAPREDTNKELWIERMLNSLKHSDLSSRELKILSFRFPSSASQQDRKTLGEVSDIVGITKERIRQIQSKALKKLKEQMQRDLTLCWD